VHLILDETQLLILQPPTLNPIKQKESFIHGGDIDVILFLSNVVTFENIRKNVI